MTPGAGGGDHSWRFGDGVPPRDALPATPDVVLIPGQRFANRYQVGPVLGRGGMGMVYRVRDLSSGGEVALKVLSRTFDPAARQRLHREGLLTASLSHPGIVRLLDAGESDGVLYIAYELIQGQPLEEAWAGRSLPDRLYMLLEVFQAVGHAHSQGVVHRDLKPGNVLVDTAGRPRVLDFGLGWKDILGPLTQTGELVGTPSFMAPEQFVGTSPTTPAVDVWALGVILYRCLTGAAPFQAEGLIELQRCVRFTQPVLPRARVPNLPGALEHLCLRCLEKEPTSRFQDARALAMALQAALDSLGVEPGRRGPGGTLDLEWESKQERAPVDPNRETVIDDHLDTRVDRAVPQGRAGPGDTADLAATLHDSPTLSASMGHVGKYQITDELAQGSFGRVFRALHPELGRDVAVKVLLPEALSQPRQRERFRLESLATARLRHPHIVAVHDVGEDEDSPFLVMDLVEGESLQDKLDREGSLALRDAVELTEKLAGALRYAHEQLILHRDVKPANILLSRMGEPMLADFGLAEVLDLGSGGPAQTGHVVGTPEFMAPEQLDRALAVDARADVYSLGATLYASITGAPPFEREDQAAVLVAVANEEPTPPSQLRVEIDVDLETICLKCLEKQPEGRYETAKALQDDLRRYLASEPIEARPQSALDRLGKWGRRNPAALRAATIAGAVLAVAVSGVALGVGRARAATQIERAVARQDAVEKEIGARRQAAEDEHRRLVDEARRSAEFAWKAMAKRGEDAPRDVGAAYEALRKAQTWRDLAPEDRAAAQAQFQAALAMAEAALGVQRWGLARQAVGQAQGLGIDDRRARRLEAKVDAARQAEALRRREQVTAVLRAVRNGTQRQKADGLRDAVFTLVRYPDPDSIGQLLHELEQVTARLVKVECELLLEANPTAAERRMGISTLVGLEQAVEIRRHSPSGSPLPPGARAVLADASQRLEQRTVRSGSRIGRPSYRTLLAWRQRDRLAPGERDMAWVACEALGRIGGGERTIMALAGYVHSEADGRRSARAALALCRMKNRDALTAVQWALASRREDKAFVSIVGPAFERAITQPEENR